MRKISVVVFFTSLWSMSYGQFPGSVDSLYTFIKSNSILRTTVEWTQIDEAFQEQIHTAKSLKDTMNCFVFVLKQLNDYHTQIFLNNEYYGYYPSFEDSVLIRLKTLSDRSSSSINQIHSEIISKEIGYIRVPTMQVYNQLQINNYAQSMADKITELSKNCKNGFIIDLRLNGGGNVYPMLSGLSLFMGNKTIGYETDVDEQVVRSWVLENGNFVIGGYPSTNIKVERFLNLDSIPIVVIIGPVTRSSGSMTAIAFKGRPNTIFIGEPTANGYTTSNGYFQFASNLTLNFATNYVADRNKNIYKTTVNPDIIISHGDNFDHLMEDKKIQFAINWLNGK